MMQVGTYILMALLVGGYPSDPKADFNRALHALSQQDYPLALSSFEAALTSDPDNLRYGSEYRMAVVQSKSYDRCHSFFEELVAQSPNSVNAYLNFAFAYIDKIPEVGAITGVILANTALSYFTRSIELHPTWIGYYSRGNGYIYWPKIFNRTQLGIDDLMQAMKIQKQAEKRSYHLRTYVALGDGYWKLGEHDNARAIWREGVEQFPSNPQLEERLSKNPEQLDALMYATYDPTKRVDTSLEELWRDN